MADLYVLVGIPGSGKSTVAKKAFSGCNCEIIESDALREELYGSAEEQRNPKIIFGEMFRRTMDALKSGKNVCYDATNISPKNRKSLLRSLEQADVCCRKIAIVFDVDPDICKEQNRLRKRVVPDYVIDRMARNLVDPSDSEGWDEVFYIIKKEKNG